MTIDKRNIIFSDRSDGLKRNNRHTAWGRIYNVIRRQIFKTEREVTDRRQASVKLGLSVLF